MNTTEAAPKNVPELLSTCEAARLAGVSQATISGWIASEYLPAVRIRRRRFVHRADLAEARRIAHAGHVLPAWRADRRRVGRRLQQVREAAGLSQLALAARAGVSHEVLSLLELGRRAPQAGTVHKLAGALAVDPERFVAHDPIGLSGLSIAEAAGRLGVPPERLQCWLRDGVIAGSKVSGRWRVPAVAVAELERSGRLRGTSRRLDPRYRG